MTKKLKNTLIATLGTFALLGTTATYANDTNVSIDGTAINWQSQRPVIEDGRTLVPIRDVFEGLGFDVAWDGATQTVTLERPTHTVLLTVGQDTFTTNGYSHELDVPAQIINGSTLLPLRAVVESIGYTIGWDGATSTVLVLTDTATPIVETTTPVEAPVDETPQLGELTAPTQVRRNEHVTVTFTGQPNTTYNLAVHFASWSTAAGLGNATSDDQGLVSWTFQVGGNTGARDNARFLVTGDGVHVEQTFAVIVD